MYVLTEEFLAGLIGKMNQGYCISAVRTLEGSADGRETARYYGVVLAINKEAPCSHVTWEFNLPDSEERVNYYWGHYFTSECADLALRDFHARGNS